jgi:myo-inositol 2-dehydrogenase/D-chiro-inositol 1-dehydrogenase
VVCAATPAHAEIAEAVAAAGRHLYLEKPVGLDLARAVALRDSLAAAETVAAVGFNYRFSPAFAELRRRLVAGEAGEVRRLRCWHCEAGDPERMPAWKRRRATGGGVMLDVVSHSVDMARWLLGEEVASVESARVSSAASEHDDAELILRMDGGPVVELVSSFVRGRKHRWEAQGSAATLLADRWPARTRRRRRPSRSGPSELATRLLAIPIPRREPSFDIALGRFADAISGADSELASIADGVSSLEVVLEAERRAGIAA